MGLLASCARAPDYETARDCIRVQQLNGFAYQFVVSVRVKDLLLRHPNHFICSSRGLQACDPHPLPPEEELRRGGLYFLLPFSALQTQDWLSLASQLISISKKLKVAHGGSVYPLEIENDDSNQMRNSGECVERLLAEAQQSGDSGELKPKVMGICETPEMRMAYRQYFRSKSSSWRPGLCSIDESCFIEPLLL